MRYLLLTLFLFCTYASSLTDTCAATIGIVRDGSNSWYFNEQVDDVKAELAKLSDGDYLVSYKTFSGDWKTEEIEVALNNAMQDPDVDIVYAAGMAASLIARMLPEAERSKPVFGGSVVYSEVREYPITPEGGSSVPNFSFTASPQRIMSDLELLYRLTEAKTVYVLIGPLLKKHFKVVDEVVIRNAEDMDLTLRFVSIDDATPPFLSQIPDDAEAVYVGILGRLGADERRALFKELQARKLVNVAMAGERDIVFGAMASLASDIRQPISRRIALNLHQLIKGANTSDLPVYIPVQDRLTINMPAAKEIGWSPDYSIALEAIIVGMGALEGGQPLSLTAAMNLAAAENVELAIAQARLDTQRASEQRARGALRPSVSLEGAYGQTEISHQDALEAPDEIHGGNYGVQLTQILFNDSAWSGAKAATALARAEEWAVESARLDAMEAAGMAYYNLLLRQDLYRIQQEHLRLTDNNYRLARLRQSIGAADPSEIYRWESSAAQDRAALFKEDGELRDALAELNRILGVSQDSVWSPEDVDMADESFHFLDDEMSHDVKSYAKFKRYREYFRFRAASDSPELKRFDAALDAQGFAVKQVERRRFVPEISGITTWNRVPMGSSTTPDMDQDEWFIGIAASLPLYEGGAIRARADEEQAKLAELQNQRVQALQFIDQEAVGVWNNMGSQHPSIRLSRKSRDAAREAYAVVQDKYAQGAANILDMLDAQVQLVNQEQQAAIALYNYLINIIQLQRVVSWFEHEQSPEQRKRWADGLKQFLDEKEIP
jgi:outer membrane protein